MQGKQAMHEIREAVRLGRDIAAQCELGLADRPLYSHFDRLITESDGATPMSVALVRGDGEVALFDRQTGQLVDADRDDSFAVRASRALIRTNQIAIVDTDDKPVDTDNEQSINDVCVAADCVVRIPPESGPLEEHNSTPRWIDESPLKEELQSRHIARRVGVALGVMDREVARRESQIENRHHSLNRRLNALQEAQRDRSRGRSGDELERALRDSIEGIGMQCQERLRERTHPASGAVNTFRNLLEDLSNEDFDIEPEGRRIQIRLNQAFQKRGLRDIRDQFQKMVAEDREFLTREFEHLETELKPFWNDLNADTHRFDGSGLTEAERVAGDQLYFEPEVNAEIRRRGAIDRLSQGRRPVFAIMMTVSLVGAAFGVRGGLMGVLAPILLLLFLGGFFWTFRSFAQERREQLDRERRRLIDSLRNEMSRSWEQVCRCWNGEVNSLLRGLERRTLRHLNDLRQQRVEAMRREDQRVGDEIQTHRKTCESEFSALTAIRQRIERIRDSLRRAEMSLDRCIENQSLSSSSFA